MFISMKLQNYTQRLDQGEDLSSDELAEVFGLQAALNSYKSLLNVSKMNNINFFYYFDLESITDSAIITNYPYDLSREQYENLRSISMKLQNYIQKLDRGETLSNFELLEFNGFTETF